ncbi:MAG: hypothetical protein AAF135_18995 [Bacteroidota bacterium]
MLYLRQNAQNDRELGDFYAEGGEEEGLVKHSSFQFVTGTVGLQLQTEGGEGDARGTRTCT